MADESVWTGAIPYVQDGDAVSAAITNPPLEVLAARTQALRDLVNAIEAGEQITLRNAPLAASISAGTVVFFDSAELVHDKYSARRLRHLAPTTFPCLLRGPSNSLPRL